MLRNVAIPLMLAASEAEAANPPIKPTDRMVERALNEDRAKPFPGLIAAAAACTVAQTEKGKVGTVANLDGALTTAKDNLKKAELVVAGLVAKTGVDGAKADGAWTVADAARKKAVDAAVGLEINAKQADGKTDNTIPGLIDKQDAADADERAKAAAYWAAKVLWDTKSQAAKDALTAKNNADAMAGTLKKAQEGAFKAVEGIKLQLTNERKWRSWLYCELGAAAGFTNEDANVFKKITGANKNWYNMLPGASAATSVPQTCTVPKDGGREAVQYFFLSKTPGAGSDGTNWLSEAVEAKEYAGAKRWSAALAATNAATKMTTESARGLTGDNNKSNATGLVAFWTGQKKRCDWIQESATQETAYYKAVEDARAAVKIQTAVWVQDKAFNAVYSTVSPVKIGVSIGGKSCNTAGGASTAEKEACNSPTKQLGVAMKAWKEDTTSGSNHLVGAAPTVGSANAEWLMTWKTDLTSMDAFITWNGKAGAGKKQTQDWQKLASAFSTAVQDWYAFKWVDYLDSEQSGTVSSVDETDVQAKDACKTGQDGFDATQVTKYKQLGGTEITVDDVAKCKNACLAYTIYNLMQRTKTQDVAVAGSTAPITAQVADSLFGVQSFPVVSKNGKACYAYSFLTTGKKCYINPTTGTPTKTGATDGSCFKMVDANKGPGKMLTLQKAVVTAWAKVAPKDATTENAEQTKVRAAMPASATLQGAWMEAWYDQQYWKQIDTNLAAGKEDKVWADLAKVTNATDAKLQTNLVGAKAFAKAAADNLSSATDNLTLWKQTKTNADTNKQNIVDRLKNSTDEITSLLTFSNGLSSAGTPSTASPGILDTRYKTTLDAYNAYIKGVADVKVLPWGTQQKAIDALAKANAEVVPNTAAGKPTTDIKNYTGKGQTKIRDAANEAWLASIKTAKEAAEALTKALGKEDLVKLRAAVTSNAKLWKEANATLLQKQGDVAKNQNLVTAAAGALAKETAACQVKAYDAYRATFEAAMVKRGKDLIAIKALITTELTRAVAGDEGSRCEKAPSNGDWRPDREEERVCVSGLCCGAARIWYTSGTTKDAAWRTIESCQPSGASKYKYQPPRAPMATAAPTVVEVTFACIEGAQRLAAAAAAMAAAYMLA